MEKTENQLAKERVQTELYELKEKIVKLSNFLFGPDFIKNSNISNEMRHLMRQQLDKMQDYAEILQRRLAIWDKTDEELYKGHNLY